MADVLTPEQRRYNMSRIRSQNTKPEELVRKYLFSQGFRYRKNDVRLPGKPDIVLPKYKTVIFVNGCFWHGHNGCRYFVWPKSNEEFWKNKIESNISRDDMNFNLLRQLGWNVIIIWECELTLTDIKLYLISLGLLESFNDSSIKVQRSTISYR